MHDPLGAVLPRRLENIQCAEHVRLHIGLRRDIGIGYRDQRGEMKDDFVAVHEAADEGRIANVAAHEIDLLSDRLGQIVQPAMAVERIVLRQSRYFGSCAKQELPSGASR